MGILTIGIIDTEQSYVERLCAGLNRLSAGQWRAFAFTKEEALEEKLEQTGLWLILATDIVLLQRLKEKYEEFRYLWLTGNEKKEIKEIGRIYRYQGIHGIAKELRIYINHYDENPALQKPLFAVYSPVGRCGKTNLALSLAKASVETPWCYIGLETYSSFAEGEAKSESRKWETGERGMEHPYKGEEFIYYLKERQGEQLLALLEACDGILPTGRNMADIRLLLREDISWFRNWFDKSSYGGAVFDVGTAVLQDITIFSVFDRLIVPYLEQERAEIKKQHFEKLLQTYGKEEILQKLFYVDMSQKGEIAKVIDLVTGGIGDGWK